MKVLFLGPACADLIDSIKALGDEVVQTEDKITGDSPVLDDTEFLVSYRYQHILRPDVLDCFPRRVINLHISCLPWNRGRHPNVWSFMEDSPKGVTIHYIDPGVDTGDILAQEEVQFSGTETLRTSYDTLSVRIEALFMQTWPDICSGRMEARPQPPGGSEHKLKDLKRIEHLLVKGWDTPVAGLIGKGVELKDRGNLMERAVKSSNLVQRSDVNRRYGRNDFTAWVNELTAPLEYRSVLDVCCGTGNQLLHFAARSGLRELVGVDLSGDSLEKARARLAETGFDRKLSLLKTSMEEMFSRSELSGSQFDLISCFYGLYYSQNVKETLHGMLGHLSVHGTLLIVGPYGKNNASLFELLQRHFPLPDLVLRSATTFMEQEVHLVLTAHTNVEAVSFVNPVEYPEPQALMDYWRASTFYSKEHEPAVLKDVENHFRRDGSFVVEKHVMAYIARKA